jgi:DNA primase large subunit
LAYEPLSFDELDSEVGTDPHDVDKTAKLRDLVRQVPFADLQSSVYYKVPFEDAIDLLRDRKVFLLHGYAYVSRANLSAIIAARFRANLSLHLGQTCRATAQMRQDVRIVPLVNMLAKQYITPSYSATKIEGAVTKEQLPALAERSFPLCMSEPFHALKKDNHLMHGARMQLGLFLKGIGLSLNDALAFWKQSFARKTPPEKFDKEYAYNIRHNYGKGQHTIKTRMRRCWLLLMYPAGAKRNRPRSRIANVRHVLVSFFVASVC